MGHTRKDNGTTDDPYCGLCIKGDVECIDDFLEKEWDLHVQQLWTDVISLTRRAHDG